MKKKRVLTLFLFLSLFLTSMAQTVQAQEDLQPGEKSASVQSKGTISFRTQTSSTGSTSSSDDPRPSTSSSDLLNQKGGKLPNTGESRKGNMPMVAAGIVLLLGTVLSLWCFKKETVE